MASQAASPQVAIASSSTSKGRSALLSDLPRHRAAPNVELLAAAKPVQRDNNVTKHVYIATHDRTQPPADQVVTTERQNILLRQFHARNESRRAQKRMTSQSSESTSLVAPAPKRPRDASRGAANS